MSIIIGIDIGGSNTKIVGLRDEKLFSPVYVKANDPVASLYGAFGKFVSDNGLQLGDINQVMITGVGAKAIKEKIFGIPTAFVDEFICTGIGGLYLADRSRAVVVSMGTGTAFISADGNQATHLGGTGVGGGTLTGLSRKMLNMTGTKEVLELAKNGNLSHIDLSVGDITKSQIETLTPDATAANFGKHDDLATKEDIALGIINLICQTIGMLASFAARMTDNHEVILTGYLSKMPQTAELFQQIEKLHGQKFIIPENSEFATAIGAALASTKNCKYTNL